MVMVMEILALIMESQRERERNLERENVKEEMAPGGEGGERNRKKERCM